MLARTKLSSKAEKLRDDIPRRVQNNDDKTVGCLCERGVLGKRIAFLIGAFNFLRAKICSSNRKIYANLPKLNA